MTRPDDPLRLGLTALQAGLIDPAQLARLALALGQHPERTLADLLTPLVGPEAVAALQTGQGTLGFEARLSPGEAITLAMDTRDSPGGDAGVALDQMLALGLPPDVFAQRYQIGSELGRGGVGVVVGAQDALMGRVVAIKSLHGAADSPDRLDRFVAEARTTAQLDHPNVVPVHDFGQLADGRPCFTMRRVRGRSLEAVLKGLAAGEPELAAQFTRYRLLQVLMQVCMAVDYAHSKGVVHRDLKPANVMVGDFGEVLVMDWGVAKVAGQSLVEGPADEAPVSLSSSGGTGTLQGAIVGTPGYMPPEQARGEVEAVDARSDVWALGALLYELLTGERPVAGKTALAMLIATVQGDIEPPSARAPQRAVPADLEEICLKALAAAPADRYPSARALHADLEQYLAGTREQARRREDADRLVADGDESLWYIRTLEAELAELDARLASLPPLTGQEPQDTKRERWATEDRVEHLRAELDRAFHYARGKFLQATERVSDHGDARARLSDLHWTRYRAARAAAEHREAEDHLKAVGRFQDPRYVQRLRREVPLTLRSDPPGARVTLHRVGERDRVLTPDAGRALGQTPLEGVPLPTGRHLLVLEVPGRRPVRLPLLVWPGDEPDFHVPIPPDEVLGDDFVYVPAGHFVRGNDPHAVLANPGGLVHLDAFAIQRFPVTVGEYFAFLDALPPEQAARHQPREPRVGPLFPPPPDGRWRAPMVDLDGDPWPADWAIFSISFHDAEAYAAWRSLRDGQRYRLPTEDEWEKAARGTDGRRFPWGDHFHPTFCSNRTAVPGHVMPRPVGHFATDCSPYGVRDMAGGVREWTDAWFEEGQRVIRGGAFSLYPFLCRVAGRWGAGPHTTQPNYGFRLVKSLN